MPKLIYHDSDGVDKVINLGAEPMLIGRATECQIQTQDAMVSRRHARIVWDGNYWIEDLGSSNGVYVGNERVQRAPFRPGDTVTCGSLVLRLMPDTAPRTTSQANLPTMLPPPAAPPPAAPGLGPPSSRVPTDNPPAYRGPAASPVAPAGGGGDLDFERRKRAELETALDVSAREITALRRKVDQLNADLKRLKGGAPAAADEDEHAARLAAEDERDRLKLKVEELTRRLTGQSTAPTDGESQKLKRQVDQLTAELRRMKTGQPAAPAAAPPPPAAPAVDPAAADTVILLSDALAELRASLRAANGEAALLKEPAESAQVVGDALKSAAEQLETARANVRALAKLLGV